MKSWIVLLGGNELNGGFPEVANVLNCNLAVIDWNETPAIQGDCHIRLDIKATADVLAAVTKLPGEISFAYSSADVAAETVAQINKYNGLMRPPPEALERASNKLSMNEAWQTAGLLNKEFSICNTPSDLKTFADKMNRDIIVKPIDSSSSRGITVVPFNKFSSSNWEYIYTRASTASSNNRALAEEYIQGTEYTVEMVGDRAGNVQVWGVSRKYHTSNTLENRIAVKLHYNPPEIPAEKLNRIAAFGSACYRALGLHCSLGHFELIEKPGGDLIPVELAARSSGYIATHLVSVLANDVGSYLQTYRNVLNGNTIENNFKPATRSSMYFFYDPPAGIWMQNNINIMNYLPQNIISLAHSRHKLRANTRLGSIDSDGERHGFEVLVGRSRDLAIGMIARAEDRLYRDAINLSSK